MALDFSQLRTWTPFVLIIPLLLLSNIGSSQTIVIDGLSDNQLVVNPVGGATNVPVFGFYVHRNSGSPGATEIHSFKIKLSKDPTGVFVNPKLYRSTDDNFGSDTFVDVVSLTQTGGNYYYELTLTNDITLMSSNNRRFFLVVDIPNTVTQADGPIKALIEHDGDITVSGSSSNTGTPEGPDINFTALTATTTQETVATPAIKGNHNVALLGFNVTSNGAQTLNSLTFTFDIDPTGIFSNYKLVASTTNDYATGTLTPVGTTTGLDVATLTVTFSTINSTLSTATEYYFLVADVNVNASTDVNIDLTTAGATPGGTSMGTISQLIDFVDPTATFAKITVGSGPVTGGTSAVPLIGISATSDGDAQTLDELTFELNVDPTDTDILTNFRLFQSTDNNYAHSTPLNITPAPTATTVTFALTGHTLSSTNKYYFLVTDVSPNASSGSINSSLAGATVSAGNTSGITPTPFSQSVSIQKLVATIAQVTNGIPAAVVGGKTGIPFIGLSASTNGNQTLNTLTFTLDVDPTNNNILTNFILVQSADNDYTHGTSLGITPALNATNKTVTFSLTGQTLSSTNKYYFLVADISPNASSGSVASSLTAANVSAGDISGITPTPFSQSVSIQALMATFAQITNGIPAAVVGGTADIPLIGLSAGTNGSQTLNSMTFTLDVNPTDNNILTNFRLFQSADNDYTHGTPLSVTPALNATNKTVIFSLTGQTLSSTNKYYFLVADVSPSASSGSIASSLTAATVSAGNISGIIPFSQSVSIQALVTTFAQITAGIPAAVVGGTAGVPIIGLSAGTNGNQTLNTLTFTLDINPTNNNILTNFKLIQSADNDYTHGTPLSITPTLNATNKTVTFSSIGQTLSSTGKYYFLIADVSPNASGSLTTTFTSAGMNRGSTTGTGFSQGPITLQQLLATVTQITGTPIVTGPTLEAGTPDQAIAGFSIVSNGDQQITSLTFNLNQVATGSFTNFRLFRSTTSTTSGSQVASLGANPTGTTVTFSSLTETVTTSTGYYYLVANVAGNATGSSNHIKVTFTNAGLTLNRGQKGTFSFSGTEYDFRSSQTSTVAVNDSGQNALDGTEYTRQTYPGLTTGNSIKIFAFTITDADADALPTTITSLTLQFNNTANLRGVALFDGTTKITGSENAAAETIVFSPLTLAVPDGSTGTPASKTINVYVTFNTSVTDNDQISVTLTNAGTAPAGSGLTAFSNIKTATGKNPIQVVLTRLRFDAVSGGAITPLADFGLSVRATDANGNLDTDATGNVTLSRQSGPAGSSLSSTDAGNVMRPLSSGVVSWSHLQLSLASPPDHVIRASHANTSITTDDVALTVTSNGVDVAGPANQNFCPGGIFTTINNIVLSESDPADFSVGNNVTYSIILPENFVFNTTITPALSKTGTNISAFGTSSYPSNNIFRFAYTIPSGQTTAKDVITISGLQVKYMGTTPVNNQPILRIGGSAIQIGNSVDDAEPHGTLSAAVPSTPVTFFVEAIAGNLPVNPDQKRFSKSGDPVKLVGRVGVNATADGDFAGNGVINTQSTNGFTFNPSLLATGGYPVKYTYTESTSGQHCKIITEQTFDVFTSNISGLDIEYCNNAPASGALTVDNSYITTNYPGYAFQDIVYWDGSTEIPMPKVNGSYVFNPSSYTAALYNQSKSQWGYPGIYIGFKITNGLSTGVAERYYIKVNLAPTVTFSIPKTTFCADDAAVELTGSPRHSTNAAFDFFSSVAPISHDAATDRWLFNPALAGAGTTTQSFNITYTYRDPGTTCSTTSAPQNVTVYPRPGQVPGTAITSGTTVFTCQDVTAGSFTTNTATGVTYRWYADNPPANSGTALKSIGNAFNPNGLFDVSTPGSTSFYVTQTVNGCESINSPLTVQLTVNSPALANAGNDVTICSGNELLLSAVGATIGGAATSASWTVIGGTTGKFLNAADTDITSGGAAAYGTAVKYIPSTVDLNNGSFTLRLTTNDPNGPCTAVSDDVLIVINAVAVATAYANNQKPLEVCSGDAITLNGIIGGAAASQEWFKSSISTASSLGTSASTTYTPTAQELQNGADIDFIIQTNDPTGPCPSVTDHVIVSIKKKPIVDAGANQLSLCASDARVAGVQLAGTVGGDASSATWSGGAGSFADDTALAAIYHPGTTELQNKTDMFLTLTTNDPAGPCIAESDVVRIVIFPEPAAPIASQPAEYCVNNVISNLVATGSNLKWYDDASLSNQVGIGPSFATGVTSASDKTASFYVTQTADGCESPASTATIIINPLPEPRFHATNFCLGDAMKFLDASTLTYQNGESGSITEWAWNFDDGDFLLSGSGAIATGTHGDRTTGSYDNPSHKYAALGSYNVTLTTTTSDGCTKSITINDQEGQLLRVGPVPQVDFSYTSICKDDVTQFNYKAGTVPHEQIAAWIWSFDDPSSAANTAADANPTHQFTDQGIYQVKLIIVTDLNCRDTVTRQTPILPYVHSFPYQESFEQNNHGWVAEGFTNDGLTSWQWEEPNGNTITAAAGGSKAWFTHVNALGTYYNNERSVLYGPCIDMTVLERPVLSFDYFNNTDAGNDGVYLEVSVDNGATWSILGDVNQGLRWYDRQAILGLTRVNDLGQVLGQVGWSGNTAGWTTAKFNMDPYKNAGNLRIRFVFGSNPDNPATMLDGFAMDNFKLSQRKKIVLAENFTGISEVQNNNDFADFVPPSTNQELVKMQYHTSYKGADPIHEQDAQDINARAAFYGLSPEIIPRGYLDGHSGGDYTAIWHEDYYRSRSLQDAAFEMVVNTVPSDPGLLGISVSIEAIQNMDHDNLMLQVVVLERNVNGYDYVVRKMLPSAAGTRIPAMAIHDVVTPPVFTWKVNNSQINIDNLIIVAFIQDGDSRTEDGQKMNEVYQVAVDAAPVYLPGIVTAVEETAYAGRVIIFPNPANTVLAIQLPEAAAKPIPVTVVDTFGKEVYNTSVPAGDKTKQVDTTSFADGMYLVLIETPQGKTSKKVMIMHAMTR